MTSVIDPQTDKILNTYRQYERLVNDKDIAAQLTLAHFMDHVVCVMKQYLETPPKVIKRDTAPMMKNFGSGYE